MSRRTAVDVTRPVRMAAKDAICAAEAAATPKDPADLVGLGARLRQAAEIIVECADLVQDVGFRSTLPDDCPP